MEIIETQPPKIDYIAPDCAPQSQMTNIHDRYARDQRRQKCFLCRSFVAKLLHP